MKYLLYPVYAIGAILFTLFEIILNSLIWTSLLVWHMKLPKDGFDWKQLHYYDIAIEFGLQHGPKIISGWDETIMETLIRRLTFGDYKHRN